MLHLNDLAWHKTLWFLPFFSDIRPYYPRQLKSYYKQANKSIRYKELEIDFLCVPIHKYDGTKHIQIQNVLKL